MCNKDHTNNPLVKERLFSLKQISKKLSIERHPQTLSNWCSKGVRISRDSHATVKMEAVQIAGVFHTSIEAYQRFISKLIR